MSRLEISKPGPVFITFVIALLAAAPARAQERSHDWTAVLQLAEGTRVRVTTTRGREFQARVAHVAPDVLTMTVRWGRAVTVTRADVRELRLAPRLSVAQTSGLGLLVGGLAGLIAGKAAACDSNVCGGEGGLAVAGGLVMGTLLGGVGGVVAGEVMHARPGRLIYAAAP